MAEISIENEWLLDQDLEKVKVVNQDDVKLYRERSILGYLGPHFHLAELHCFASVPVENDEGKIIGMASVLVMNGKLLAELIIDYATPERLAAETRDGVRHWPRIVGKLEVNVSTIDIGISQPFTLTVDRLVLSTKRPADARLLPFGDPIL